jgi:hypothetical protein
MCLLFEFYRMKKNCIIVICANYLLYLITEPPLPPILTKAVSLTSTSVTLTWSPVTQKPNTLVSQFVVFYKTKYVYKSDKINDYFMYKTFV